MRRAIAAVVITAVLATGCSVRKRAMKSLGDSLSARLSESFASDNDPELVRAAVPFSLKLVESLLAESPKNEALLLVAAKGFTEYSFAFVHSDAEETQDKAYAQALGDRATKLYLRGRDYGLRALEVRHPGFALALKADPTSATSKLALRDVPLMYWTGVAWAGSLAASRDMFMLPQIPQFEALMDRALALDETYNEGAIHAFFINFEMGSPTRRGDKAARAKQHFERAVALSHGRLAAPYVTYAESVTVPAKNRAEFNRILKAALAIKLDDAPADRLQNIIFQRRAHALLSRADRLFR